MMGDGARREPGGSLEDGGKWWFNGI
jgi:hypothetical protein